MEKERRNDIGAKVLISIISVLITILMTASIISAERANETANINKTDIAVIRTHQSYQTKLMEEVRESVKIIESKL